MRQLATDEIVPPLETIGVMGSHARDLLEQHGLTFVEATDDGPGPRKWTALALDDGSQFVVEHHYAHPERFVEVGGQMGKATPAELCRRFATALGVPESEFSWVAEDWPRPQR